MVKFFQKKKKNNKGFSLVELIVVIAIMAVLVGVLAPTLIRKVEESRLSKDKQNLDNLRQAIVTALADEDFADTTGEEELKITATDNAITISDNKFSEGFKDEVDKNFDLGFSLTSKLKKGCTVKIIVNGESNVIIGVNPTDDSIKDNDDYKFNLPIDATVTFE